MLIFSVKTKSLLILSIGLSLRCLMNKVPGIGLSKPVSNQSSSRGLPYSLRKLKICLTFESSKLEEIFKRIQIDCILY